MLALRPEKYPHLKSVLPLSKLSMDILEPIHLATIEVVVEFLSFFLYVWVYFYQTCSMYIRLLSILFLLIPRRQILLAPRFTFISSEKILLSTHLLLMLECPNLYLAGHFSHLLISRGRRQNSGQVSGTEAETRASCRSGRYYM